MMTPDSNLHNRHQNGQEVTSILRASSPHLFISQRTKKLPSISFGLGELFPKLMCMNVQSRRGRSIDLYW